ncbi:MAG: DUF2066 domain-containing protein [Pseudomonadales bacterium]|nr:DUF2066 domain-containing protein [Pseudomonadales bacterium]
MLLKRIRSIWVGVAGLIALLLATSAAAVEVKDLYKATAVVADRSDASLRHGSQEALAEVVIRVCGDSTALESYDIRQAMGNPSRFIEQYGFDRITQENPETGLPEPAFELKVIFNARGINQLIRRAGLPIWASNRAELLVWLVTDDENGRRLVNADTAPELVASIQEQAQRRGLPIAFPLNDLQDQLAVTPGDVWGMFMDRIQTASERYAPGAVLVGKVYAPSVEGRLANWSLMLDNQQDMLESRGLELTEVITPAIELSADKLASKYAVTLGGGDTDFVWLNVQGVETLTDFAQLTAYLEKLVAIRQADMGQLQEDQTRFRLYLESNIENLKQLLALDKKLIEVPNQQPTLSVSLSAVDDQTVIEGDAIATQPQVEGEIAPLIPSLEVLTQIPELSYHWHRTYNQPLQSDQPIQSPEI